MALVVSVTLVCSVALLGSVAPLGSVALVGREHPGVLGSAALAGIDHQRALGQRHPGEATGKQPHVAAVVDSERPQVDVPRDQPVVNEHRGGGKRNRPLGYPVPRLRGDFGAQLGKGGLVGLRADDDAIAAGPVHRLEHQLVERFKHPAEPVRVVQPVGLDVGQQRLLAQVIPDQVGHVGVEQLVVGDAVADGIGDRDVASPGGVHDAGTADHRAGHELQRIKEIVVDAPVDHVHRPVALRRVHEDPVARGDQVAALDQFHPHQPGQQGVLEVRGVVHPGGQDDDHRIPRLRRGSSAQCRQQPRRVIIDRVDVLLGEQRREGPGHRQPVLHHVTDPGRDADVVLKHAELALLVPDQVDARDVHPDAVRRRQAGDLAVEPG